MNITHSRDVKFAAAGYAIYALSYFAITAILFSVGGLGIFQNLDVIGGTLFLVTGGCLLNLLLAVGSWRLLTLSIWKRRLLLGSAIGMAVVFVVYALRGLWGWYRGTLPSDLGPTAVTGGTLAALGYVLIAYSLVRIVATLDRR